MHLASFRLLAALNIAAANARSIHVPLRSVWRAADSVISQPSTSDSEITADVSLGSQRLFVSDLHSDHVNPTLHRRRKFADTRYEWMGMQQVVDLLIGTPPQLFSAIIDLDWKDLWVVSVDCDYPPSSDIGQFFNGSESSSFRGTSRVTRTAYGGWYMSGHVAYDTMQIAGVEIKDQVFLNAETFHGGGITLTLSDAVLGLSRYSTNENNSCIGESNPFFSMMDQGLLDRNLFAIKTSTWDRVGEIEFGDIDPTYANELSTFDVTAPSKPFWPREDYPWHVSIHSISIGDIEYPLGDDYHLVFEASLPFIGLPLELHKIMHNFTRGDGGFLFDWIDCNRRSFLPELRFGFAKGVGFTLTGLDYIMEAPPEMEGQAPMCYSPFVPLEHNPPETYAQTIFAGTAFLKNFYAVFDFDENSVSLAPIHVSE